MPAGAVRRSVAAAAVLALLPLAWVTSSAAPAAAAVPSAANPAIPDSCGLNVTLVLDASGSIDQSHAVNTVRGAADTFLDALRNTGSSAGVTQFATVSAELAPSTLVDDTSMGQNGVLTNAVSGYYNPRPTRPPGVNFYRYNGSGSPTSAGSFTQSNQASNDQYTNWDAGLHQAGTGTLPKLVVFVTDGDPTAYDFEAADPVKPPNVAFNTGSGPAAPADHRPRRRRSQRHQGRRDAVLTVGVGSALSNPSSVTRLTQVSGPQVVRDADLAAVTSINQIDVALVTEFDDLAAFLRERGAPALLAVSRHPQVRPVGGQRGLPPGAGLVHADDADGSRRDVHLGAARHCAGAVEDARHRRQRVRPVPVVTQPGSCELDGDRAGDPPPGYTAGRPGGPTSAASS